MLHTKIVSSFTCCTGCLPSCGFPLLSACPGFMFLHLVILHLHFTPHFWPVCLQQQFLMQAPLHSHVIVLLSPTEQTVWGTKSKLLFGSENEKVLL